MKVEHVVSTEQDAMFLIMREIQDMGYGELAGTCITITQAEARAGSYKVTMGDIEDRYEKGWNDAVEKMQGAIREILNDISGEVIEKL